MKLADKTYLNFINFITLDKWFVSYYINPHSLKSSYPFKKLKSLIQPAKEKIKLNDYKGDLRVVKKISFNDGKIHLREENETKMDLYVLNPNDLLVSKINFHQGALAINKFEKIVCTTHYQPYIIDKEQVFDEFLILCLRTSKFQQYLDFLRAEGIKNEATYEFIGDLEIPLPSLKEQKEIVRTHSQKIEEAKSLEEEAKDLDIEIEKYLFDELGYKIKKTRFSEKGNSLLKFIEYSEIDKWGVDQNNISQVLSSKVFDVKRVSYICKVSSGGTPSRVRKEYYSGDIPWIKTGEVINDVIYDTEEKITIEAINDSSARIYPKGSLIIAMYGQGATRGRTAKLGIDASTNQACAVIYDINNDIILTDFLWIYLMGEYERLRAMASGNNQPNLNAQMIKDYKVIIPPKELQAEIIQNYTSGKERIKMLRQKMVEMKLEAEKEFEQTIFKN